MLAALSVVTGIFIALWLNTPAGATIVLVNAAFFSASLLRRA